MPLKSLWERIKAWQFDRKRVWHLSHLTDRELADLGIKRIDIAYLGDRAKTSG
jgi:uncharacterized protein YjiS (DUF1127 family)